MFTTENKDGKWWVVESRSNEFWTNARPSKQYPTLPEDASHWAALQGKMFGEGEFEAIPCCNTDCTGLCKVVGNLYAIPKQAEEDIEEYHGDDSLWYDVKGLFVSAMEKNVTPEEAINLMKSLGYQITRGKQSQPAIPASDEDWADTEIEFQKTKPDWRKYSRELYMEYYIEFIHANYHPPKRKQ